MSNCERQIYYTEGNWSVRWYENNGIKQLCHTHDSGTIYVIPWGFSKKNDYRCHECYSKAPETARVIWHFLNWDVFAK